MKHLKLCLVAALISHSSVAFAEREMSTDRPDATESPYTVGRGRIQVESTVVGFGSDLRGDWEVRVWNLGATNLRLGYTPNTEVQVVVDGFLDVESEHRPSRTVVREKGLGDVTVRYKWNLRGNDVEGPAYALMPFVKIPTAKEGLGNKKVEGGLIFPYAKELENGWQFGAMTEIDVVRDEEKDGYKPVWFNTVTVGHDLTQKLAGFVELTSRTGEGHHQLGFNFGVTYAVNKDLQLDLGTQVGLSRSADDFGMFLGFAKRF